MALGIPLGMPLGVPIAAAIGKIALGIIRNDNWNDYRINNWQS
jgi:hypothetical protein